MSTEEIRALFPNSSVLVETDPDSYFHYKGGIESEIEFAEHPRGRTTLRTNRLGLREDGERLDRHPDLRILVTGDSHTDGVCSNHESFTNLLESRLAGLRPEWRIEALNAAVGGYSIYNYLGVLERLAPLAPDVFVVCVFGGNDFDELLHLKRAFEGREAPPGHGPMRERIERAAEEWRGAVYQGLIGATYFAEQPPMRAEAVQGMSAVSREIVEQCRAARTAAVFVYLPPLHDVEWSRHAERLDAAAQAMGLPREQRHVLDGLADEYVSALRSMGATVLDLRAVFRASAEELYWQADAHINLTAHELIAKELTPIVSALATQRSEHAGIQGASVQASSPMPSWRDVFRDIADDPLPELKLGQSAVARLVPLGDELKYDAERLFRPPHPARPRDARATTMFLGDEFLWGSGDESFVADIDMELQARAAAAENGVQVFLTPGGGIHTALLTARSESTPEVRRVVVCVNLGNDLLDAVRLERLGRKQAEGDESSSRTPLEAEAAWCDAVAYFRAHPRRLDDALRSLARGTLALEQECGARGQRLSVVMISAAFEAPGDLVQARIDADAAELGFEFEDFERLRRAAKVYRRFVEELGLEVFRVDAACVAEGAHDAESYRASADSRRAIATRVAAWSLPK